MIAEDGRCPHPYASLLTNRLTARPAASLARAARHPKDISSRDRPAPAVLRLPSPVPDLLTAHPPSPVGAPP